MYAAQGQLPRATMPLPLRASVARARTRDYPKVQKASS